jgi:hypothetical protein
VLAIASALLLFVAVADAVSHRTDPTVVVSIGGCLPVRDTAVCHAEWTDPDGEKHRDTISGDYGRAGDQVRAFITPSGIRMDTGLPRTVPIAGVVTATWLALVPTGLFFSMRRYARRTGAGKSGRRGLTAAAEGFLLVAGAHLLLVGILLLALADGGGGRAAGGILAGVGVVLVFAVVPLKRTMLNAGWTPTLADQIAAERAKPRGARAGGAAAPTAQALARNPVGPPDLEHGPRGRSGGERWSADSVRLSDRIVQAIQVADDGRPPNEDLTTGRLLAAMARVDVHSDWTRVWLYTGSPETTRMAEALDPPAPGVRAGDWRGVPLSPRLATAFWTAGRLGETYGLRPADSGAMTLALVADRHNGAADALLRLSGLSHGRLLWIVQLEILKTRLNGLEGWLSSA